MNRVLGQRYQVDSILGEGGMGIVYQGIDTHTQQVVAIKKLKADIASPENIARFIREGEALRQLNHPNIVKMLDMVETDEYYLVMELIAGGSLTDYLTQRPSIEQLLPIALDIAKFLS